MEYIYKLAAKDLPCHPDMPSNCILVNSFRSYLSLSLLSVSTFGYLGALKGLFKVLSKKRALLVIKRGNKVVSYCWMNAGFCNHYDMEPHSIVIGTFWTDENCRGQGLATILLRAALGCIKADGRAEHAYIDTSESNYPMQAVIEKCGFGAAVATFSPGQPGIASSRPIDQ